MARVNPEQYQEKHARRLKASVPDITRGVDRVTVNPCELAAAKEEKMLTKLTEAVTSGKWAANLKKVSLPSWKDKMKTKGIPHIGAGIDGAKDKVIAFAKVLLPHVDAGVDKIKDMSDLTIDDSIARAGAFIRHMSEMKR